MTSWHVCLNLLTLWSKHVHSVHGVNHTTNNSRFLFSFYFWRLKDLEEAPGEVLLSAVAQSLRAQDFLSNHMVVSESRTVHAELELVCLVVWEEIQNRSEGVSPESRFRGASAAHAAAAPHSVAEDLMTDQRSQLSTEASDKTSAPSLVAAGDTCFFFFKIYSPTYSAVIVQDSLYSGQHSHRSIKLFLSLPLEFLHTEYSLCACSSRGLKRPLESRAGESCCCTWKGKNNFAARATFLWGLGSDLL